MEMFRIHPCNSIVCVLTKLKFVVFFAQDKIQTSELTCMIFYINYMHNRCKNVTFTSIIYIIDIKNHHCKFGFT